MNWALPVAALLNDDRLHLQHGPIDLMIEAFADDPRDTALAYEQASMRFCGLLESLVTEIPMLRTPIGNRSPNFSDAVAQRMAQAVWPFRKEFITPMAAVAGAVADEIMQALIAARNLRRAYVNNGGDIAIHLTPGEKFQVGIAGIEDATLRGRFTIRAEDNVRGIATSGWRGRSFSLGIADSVTALAENAAMADAAATMIANAVNVDHPGIERVRACDIQTESDLGSLLVTRDVPVLDRESIDCALDAGACAAGKYVHQGLIERAALRLQGRTRLIGNEGTVTAANPCHSERSEESVFWARQKQILRCAQNDNSLFRTP